MLKNAFSRPDRTVVPGCSKPPGPLPVGVGRARARMSRDVSVTPRSPLRFASCAHQRLVAGGLARNGMRVLGQRLSLQVRRLGVHGSERELSTARARTLAALSVGPLWGAALPVQRTHAALTGL